MRHLRKIKCSLDKKASVYLFFFKKPQISQFLLELYYFIYFRIRVESFNKAFAQLRNFLPTFPKQKKLSKIEILRISIAYIHYLDFLLQL